MGFFCGFPEAPIACSGGARMQNRSLSTARNVRQGGTMGKSSGTRPATRLGMTDLERRWLLGLMPPEAGEPELTTAVAIEPEEATAVAIEPEEATAIAI